MTSRYPIEDGIKPLPPRRPEPPPYGSIFVLWLYAVLVVVVYLLAMNLLLGLKFFSYSFSSIAPSWV